MAMTNQPTSRLVEAETGRVLVDQLKVANTFWRRLIGLQFCRSLPDNFGLLLTPCNSVHTFCLRFAIDIAFVDAHGTVLKIVHGVPPWRIVPPVRHAKFVVETVAGKMTWSVGTQVQVVDKLPHE